VSKSRNPTVEEALEIIRRQDTEDLIAFLRRDWSVLSRADVQLLLGEIDRLRAANADLEKQFGVKNK